MIGLNPGDRLLYDARPSALHEGDVVLFRGPDEELLLGKLRDVPRSADLEHHDAVDAGALWIEGDAAGCPAIDSRSLGPIERASIVGRVLYSL